MLTRRERNLRHLFELDAILMFAMVVVNREHVLQYHTNHLQIFVLEKKQVNREKKTKTNEKINYHLYYLDQVM